jgi:DNA-binding GntR family transcriptional regulator
MRKSAAIPKLASDEDRQIFAKGVARSPVERGERVADQVYRNLRRAIILGEFVPGSRLRETEVAAQLGVSRTPVREAISRLIGDRLVRELAAGGVEVIDATAELTDIYYIREALESCAARLAATHISAEQVARLEKLLKAARNASFDDRVQINQQFHLTIAEAAGSRRLLDMIEGFREFFLNPRWLNRHDRRAASRALQDHRNIVAALKAGAADRAERLVRQHLKAAYAELLSGRGKRSTNGA